MKRPLRIALLVPLLLTGGCANHVIYDAGALRRHAMEYYSDQVMDNLIRASNGMLFLHVNIESLNADVTAAATSGFTGGETVVGLGERSVTGLALAGKVSRSVTRPLTYMLGSSYTNKLATTTQPVTNDAKYYIPYLKYLNLKHGEQRLHSVQDWDLRLAKTWPGLGRVKSAAGLREGEDYVAGTLRRWRGEYYYVPAAFQQAYFDLCLTLLGHLETGDGSTRGEGGTAGVHSNTSRTKSGAHALPRDIGFDSEVLKQIRNRIESLRLQIP